MDKKTKNAGCLRSEFLASSAVTLQNSHQQKGLGNGSSAGQDWCPAPPGHRLCHPSHQSQNDPRRGTRPKQESGRQDLFRREEGDALSQAHSICSSGTRMWQFTPSTSLLCPGSPQAHPSSSHSLGMPSGFEGPAPGAQLIF